MSTPETGLEARPWLRRRVAALASIPPVEETTTDEGLLRVVRRFRGLTLDRALDYLVNLGGRLADEATVEGDGWRAHLTARKVPVGPSYRLTEVTVEWSGEPDRVEPVVLQFRCKTFRAPG